MVRLTRFSVRHLSVRNKLALVALAVSGLALAVAVTTLVSFDLLIFRARMTEDLVGVGRMLSSMTAAPLAFDDRTTADEMLRTLTARSTMERACLYDRRGMLFASYYAGGAACAPKAPVGPLVTVFSGPHLTLLEDVTQDRHSLGRLFLEQSLADYDARLRRHAAISVVVLLVCCLVVTPIVSPLQRFVLNPIADLVAAMKTVSEQKRFDIRVPRINDDETAVLVDGFNRMLAEIEDR